MLSASCCSGLNGSPSGSSVGSALGLAEGDGLGLAEAGEGIAHHGLDEVESPQGDDTRTWGPPFIERGARPRMAVLREQGVNGQIEMAIAVFKLNVDRFPADANAYDSLAEGYLVKGDRDEAITLYRKALELDPSFQNARRMLEQLL